MPQKRWVDRLLGDRKRLLLLMKEFNFVQEYESGRGHSCYFKMMRKVRKVKDHKPTHLNVLTGMHHWRKHQVEMRKQLQELDNVTGGKSGTASQSVETSKEKMPRRSTIDRLLDDRKFLLKMLIKHNFIAEERRGDAHDCLENILHEVKNRKPTEYEIQTLLRFWRNNESELRKEIKQKTIPKTWIDELIDDRKKVIKWMKRFNFVEVKDDVYPRCIEMLRGYRKNNPTHFEVKKMVNYWNQHESTLRKELQQDTRKPAECSAVAIRNPAESNTKMNVTHTNLSGPAQSISEHSSLPLVPVLNDEQVTEWRNIVQHEFPTIYMGTKADSLIKGNLTTPSLHALGSPPTKKPQIYVQENDIGGKQLINAAGDSVIYPSPKEKHMEMKKSTRPSKSDKPLPTPTIPNNLALTPFHSNQHLPRQDFSQAHIQSDNMPNMVGSLESLASGSPLLSSNNIPAIEFHNNNNVSRTIGPLGSGIPFYTGNNTPVKDPRGNVPGMVVGSMENGMPFNPNLNMYGRDFQGMNGSNAPRTIGPVVPVANPFVSSKSPPFRGIKDDNVASMVVGTLGSSNLKRMKNQTKNPTKKQRSNSSVPSNVHTVGKQITVKGKDLPPDNTGKRLKQDSKGKFNLSELASTGLSLTKLKKQMETDMGPWHMPGATSQQKSTKPNQEKSKSGNKALSPAVPLKKKSVKSVKPAESDQSRNGIVDTKPKKKTKNVVEKVKNCPQKHSKELPISTVVNVHKHKHRRISNSNGVEVEFEDGVRMIVKRKCDITFIDDEPIRTWDLKPGTTVAVKYADGFVYDAVVIGSVGGRKPDDNLPRNPSVIVDNTTDSSEQDECWEPKNMKLPENPMQWRCLKCCLVFRAYDFIKLHQTTVCQGPVVQVIKHIEFEENSLVTVDDDPHVWRPELKKLKIELLPGFSKNNFNFLKGARILHKWESEDGNRWYKGKVTSVTEKTGGELIPEDTPVFEVWYADDEKDRGPYDLKLLDDYPKDLRIVSLEDSK